MQKGRIHSFQSLGTLDGPGLRAVVFMQGCPLRCVCCHNPDTWDFGGGEECDAASLSERILRCKNYFGQNGGVTVSGGEPLMQADFVCELFGMLKKQGVHTALDTSGCMLDGSVKRLLEVTDLVILDFKYTDESSYLKYTGCKMEQVEGFLTYLDGIGKKTWIRQVIIEGLNNSEESAKKLFALPEKYPCICKTELLPFRKLCMEKYENLGILFPLRGTPETSDETIGRLTELKNSVHMENKNICLS